LGLFSASKLVISVPCSEIFNHFGISNKSVRCAKEITKYRSLKSHLSGIVVSVLATGPKVCGFALGQGDGFLRVKKIRSTPSSQMGSKAGRSHVIRFTACKRTL
jgi:hypothetical protein